jgi:hydroxyacylglutathione hydrolase
MRKGVKRTLVVVGVIILILILFIGINIFRFISGTKGMATIQTKEIVNGIYAINDDTANMYLIKVKNKYIAIDAAKEKDKIEQELKKLNISSDDVIAVFLTHTDWDHTGALGLFKNAKVFISNEEEQMINCKTPRFFVINNKMPYKYSLINDIDIIDIAGIKITGILTPGHTPGSMCYIVSGQYLFTGDSLSLKSGKADVFADVFNMNTAQQRDSLKKLTGLNGVKYVFTAHNGFTDNYSEAFKDIQQN